MAKPPPIDGKPLTSADALDQEVKQVFPFPAPFPKYWDDQKHPKLMWDTGESLTQVLDDEEYALYTHDLAVWGLRPTVVKPVMSGSHVGDVWVEDYQVAVKPSPWGKSYRHEWLREVLQLAAFARGLKHAFQVLPWYGPVRVTELSLWTHPCLYFRASGRTIDDLTMSSRFIPAMLPNNLKKTLFSTLTAEGPRLGAFEVWASFRLSQGYKEPYKEPWLMDFRLEPLGEHDRGPAFGT